MEHDQREDETGQQETNTRPQGSFWTNGIIQDLAIILDKYYFWVITLSCILFLFALIMGITIVGLVIAWIPCWLGIILINFAKCARAASRTGEFAELNQSLIHLNLYFKIMGILLLVLLAIYGLILILGTAAVSSIFLFS